MDSGVIWRAALGLLILGAVAGFVLIGFDTEQVDEEGDEVVDATVTPRATPTAVLTGPLSTEDVSESPGRIEEFCRELQYAEPPCAGVVSALCDEVGADHPDCQQALESYCTINLASAALCAGQPPAD